MGRQTGTREELKAVRSVVPHYVPRLTGLELSAVREVFESGFINDGPATAEFERQFAEIIGRQYAIAVPNCTTAIALALMAAGVGRGEPVIVPDFTMVATANAVVLAGCVPVFVDIRRETLCLDEDQTAAVDGAKFVVAVEVNGRPPDYDRLARVLGDRTLITDSCEALGSKGCGRHGLASCFSFAPNKIVTTGQGGIVVTDSLALRNRLRQLKYQGLDGPGAAGAVLHRSLGFNFKFTDIAAAIGLAQLKVLDERLDHCRRREQWYRQALSQVERVQMLPHKDGEALWLVDIFTENWSERESLSRYLVAEGMGVREFWLPLHQEPSYPDPRPFPVASDVSECGLWLPSSYDITESQVEKVTDAVKRWANR